MEQCGPKFIFFSRWSKRGSKRSLRSLDAYLIVCIVQETKNGCIWRDFLRLNGLEALVIARANETYVYDSSTLLYDRERRAAAQK